MCCCPCSGYGFSARAHFASLMAQESLALTTLSLVLKAESQVFSSARTFATLWVCIVYLFLAEQLLLLDSHNITLTADQSRFSSVEISLTEIFWQRWHPMTVTHLKSLSSSVQPTLLPMHNYGDCMVMCLILSVSNGYGWNTNSVIRRGAHILLAI